MIQGHLKMIMPRVLDAVQVSWLLGLANENEISR
jgi:hypothetical protein